MYELRVRVELGGEELADVGAVQLVGRGQVPCKKLQ